MPVLVPLRGQPPGVHPPADCVGTDPEQRGGLADPKRRHKPTVLLAYSSLNPRQGSQQREETAPEPGPYSTGFGGGGVRTSAGHPDHAEVRAATRIEWDLGDAEATRAPILELADTDDPPARVFFGEPLEPVAAEYEERLATWRKWQPRALAAFR
ncbi:hypothetical protein ABGB17_21200 [Sphaerisporangium sp. B11E5]|uniref:hypothetical protein n=1 Tax=Sphaerisporangium sp. B11E5 TaxID=3153563 RepID=UPI00325F4813